MSLFVADFFSGLDGWGAAFRDRGHRVVSFDLDPRFGSNVVVDMNNVKAVNGFDVILASPPCECFSVMTIGRNWNKDRTPKERSDGSNPAKAALELAWHTFALIENAKPRWYVVENPRGMLRKVAPRPPDATTWYCRWGMPYAKPTDLWTNLNGGMAIGWPACANNAPDHPYTPRGDKTVSVQGTAAARARRRRLLAGEKVIGWRLTEERRGNKKYLAVKRDEASMSDALRFHGRSHSTGAADAALRAVIPYRLSLAVCLAAERDGTLPSMEEVIATEAELRRVA